MLQWNERTRTMTRERLGTAEVYEYPLADVYPPGWEPHGGYIDDLCQISPQIVRAAREVVRDPTTRRAVVHNVGEETHPCLSLCQFMVRRNTLHAFFYWRSSSDVKRQDDWAFMRWLAATFIEFAGLKKSAEVNMVRFHVFRASDHDILQSDDGDVYDVFKDQEVSKAATD